jgi:hypothetical protein
MELIAVLAVGLVLAIPVLAIIAMVKVSGLSQRFQELEDDQRSRILDLEGEVSRLRSEVAAFLKLDDAASAVPATKSANELKPAVGPAEVVVSTPPDAALRPEEFVASPVQARKQDFDSGLDAFSASSLNSSMDTTIPETVPEIATAREAEVRIPASLAYQLLTHPEGPQAEKELFADSADAENDAQPFVAPAASQIPTYSAPVFADFSSEPPRPSFAERIRMALPLEEVLGTNLFAKIGIALLVLGFAFLGKVALLAMGPVERVGLIYAAAVALLGGGIRIEGKERYRLVARAAIGGGWALLFFTTFAMHYISAMQVIASNTLDCVLMLLVAAAMVSHTLRYRSQVVTGLAFILAFLTVALGQDTIYSLTAGVILALAIAAIALRMNWFELEVLGILASFANHYYWLYRLYPEGIAGHPFPQFWPSAIILTAYWAIFRVSYVARSIHSSREEQTSTIAAILNTIGLLTVMKFQSTHPELAFYALLGLGALEFAFGQLPITRRRRAAFTLLTVLGSLLVFTAVPFKFSGDNIAFFWMIVAEALLVAGITQKEIVFRRLGLLGGIFTGGVVLYEALSIIDLRQHSDKLLMQDGVLLLACAVFFYATPYFLARRWPECFQGIDNIGTILHSYIAGATAFLGIWALCSGDAIAVGWALLLLVVALGVRYLKSIHLQVQAFLLILAILVQDVSVNCRWSEMYPLHAPWRLVTLPAVALIFYMVAWLMRGLDERALLLRRAVLWSGSTLLIMLAWFEVSQPWVAVVWAACAVLLLLAGRKLRISDLLYQQHILALAIGIQLLSVNLGTAGTLQRYLPIILCSAVFYAISRVCTLPEAVYRRPAGWAHTWAATALLAVLAWNNSPQPWVPAIWAGFALTLALIDRIFVIEELPLQAHCLALLSIFWVVFLDMFDDSKWHGIDIRLIAVAVVIVVLYSLARWIRWPDSMSGTNFRHLYTWPASALLAWLLWSELQTISVAVALAVLGLLLFECGDIFKQPQLRLQAYVALAASFGRIFFVNLTAQTLPGDWISPRLYTVLPIACIHFFLWTQLQTGKVEPEFRRFSAADLMAWFGSGCITGVLYFQVLPEWVVAAWSGFLLLLVLATHFLKKEVFLQQAALLTIAIVTRAIGHNIFGASYFSAGTWHGNFMVLAAVCLTFGLTLPFAFQLQKRYAEALPLSKLSRQIALNRIEQWLFFAPALIAAVAIAVQMNPGMVTLAWGVEGVLVILLGLLSGQRSYRITGLILLLTCVGKILLRDAWHLSERDRYITFIALGGALTLVSGLYGRYRETVRRLL